MASTEGLEAISRDVPAADYDNHPCPSLINDVDLLSSQIQSLAFYLLDESAAFPDEKLLVDELKRDPIYKIEQNLWKNRQYVEEIIDLLDKSRLPLILRQPSTTEDSELDVVLVDVITPEDKELDVVLEGIADVLQGPLADLVSFQDTISKRVFLAVTALVPQCIRRVIVRVLQDHEINWKGKLDGLVTSGASKGARCALLCEQHTHLRSKLIAIAASVGFFETSTEQNEISLRKVVLDAFPTIRDEDWPMEDQRRHVGRQLYQLTTMILSIRLFVSLLWGRCEARKLKKNHAILKKAVDVYVHEFERVLSYTREVFDDSSLSTSAVVGCGMSNGDFKVVCVSALKTHVDSLQVDTINSKVAWDFSLYDCANCAAKVKWDIGFSVECTDASGKTTVLLPNKQYMADKGSLVVLLAGEYKFIWDNTDQFLVTKFIRYKLGALE